MFTSSCSTHPTKRLVNRKADGGLSGTASRSAPLIKLWNSVRSNSSLRLPFQTPRNLLLGLLPSPYLTLLAICLALLTSSLASSLLTVAVLFLQTFGIASFLSANPVGLCLLPYRLPLAHLGSLALRASAHALLEPPPGLLVGPTPKFFLASVASFLHSFFFIIFTAWFSLEKGIVR